MSYRIRFKRSAEKELFELPKEVARRVDRKMSSLAENPYGRGVRKLSEGFGYRARVGPYRIIFTIDDANRIIEIIAIRHRREAYR